MSYLLFGGGLYMLLIALVWIIQPVKNSINYYLAATYSSSGFIVLYAWAERTNLIYSAYLLYNIQIPLCFAFGPLLYFGFSQIADFRKKPTAFDFRHLIPAAVSVAIIIGVNVCHASLFAGPPGTAAPIDLLGYPVFFAIHLLGIGADVYILYFLTRIIIMARSSLRDNKPDSMKELKLLLIYVALFIFDIFVIIVAHLKRNRDLLHLGKLLSSITFILYSFYSFRYPEYSQKIIRKAKFIRYKNTQLRGLNAEELLDRLDYLMSNEKIYKNMDLTLLSLSAQLMVKPHQLSEVFNDYLHMNFRSYLNDFRVHEAKRVLIEHPGASIIEIAFEVGFNSKTSFNDNFLQKTGLTPSEYRKNHAARSVGSSTKASVAADGKTVPTV